MLKKLMISAAVSALMVSGAMAQVNTPANPPTAKTTDAAPLDGAKFIPAQGTDQWVFSKFKGTDVIGPDNAQVGSVNDMLFDKNGKIVGLIVGVGGFLGIGEKGSILNRWLEPVFPAEAVGLVPKAGIGLTVVAVATGLLGLSLAYTFYLAPGATKRRQRITTPLAPVRELLKHKYYVDELYGAVIVRPALALANAAAAFDTHVIDGAVMGVGKLVGGGAAVLRRMQSGLVRRYVMTMLGGIVLVVAIFLFRVH